MKGFTRKNSDEIGFVLLCLFNQIVDLDELNLWCY